MTRDSRLFATVAAMLVIVAFARGFGMYPFYDDWLYLSAAGKALAHHAPGEFIWSAFPPHWSPLSFAFWIFNLRFVGWENDALIRSTNAVMVWLGVTGFALFARRLGASRAAVLVGMGTLALHHINAAPYYAWDCFDQLAADLLTWTSVALMITTLNVARPQATKRVALAIALVVPALLIKEEGLTAVAGTVVLATWSSVVLREETSVRRLRWSAASVAVLIAAVFAGLRWRAGLWFDASGPYRFCATCVPGNVGLLMTSVLVPQRTLDIFLAVRQWPPVIRDAVPALLASLAVVACVALGLMSRATKDERRIGMLCTLLFVTHGFPVVLQENVTELHAHTALFWWALLVAMAFDGWRTRLQGSRRATRILLAGAAAVYVLSLSFGLQRNLTSMRSSGTRSHLWRERLHAWVERYPSGSRIFLRGLPMVKGARDYGLYRVTTPGYLLAGTAGLDWQERVDMTWCVDPDACGTPDHVLEIDAHDRVRVLRVAPQGDKGASPERRR